MSVGISQPKCGVRAQKRKLREEPDSTHHIGNAARKRPAPVIVLDGDTDSKIPPTKRCLTAWKSACTPIPTAINPSHKSPSTSTSHCDEVLVRPGRGSIAQIDNIVRQHFNINRQTDDHFKRKNEIVSTLYATISQAFGGCGLYVTGSSYTGLGSCTGDLDMSLMIHGHEMSSSEASNNLMYVERSLYQIPGQIQNIRIIRAIVPIIQFFTRGVECEISVNNTAAIRNSHLIKSYCACDRRVAPLVLFVKHWAKFQNINSAKDKTMSSYVITLLVLHYLQSGVPGRPVLPCLQQQFPGQFSDRKNIGQLSLNFDYQPLQQNTMALGELLLGFLKYYATKFQFDRHVASVRCGRVLNIEEVKNRDAISEWKPRHQMPSKSSWINACMFVEEPYNLSNVARSVYDRHVFNRIHRVFKASYEKLRDTMDAKSIISCRF